MKKGHLNQIHRWQSTECEQLIKNPNKIMFSNCYLLKRANFQNLKVFINSSVDLFMNILNNKCIDYNTIIYIIYYNIDYTF